ncbi:MAG: response regulator transcription factor [Sulfurimonas sp.]|jgi:DNA-binding response OmpR family regulator|nr:response regulator transcription factor [Sulfurimonadaceae bacterium]
MKKRILKELKVLYVEDEQSLASGLKSAIGDNFFSFLTANDGEEGLEVYKKIKPDIIISDISMPKLSGLEMAKFIRDEDVKIPIIIISAFSDRDKLMSAIDIGITKYFIKPLDPDELLSYLYTLSPRFESKIVELSGGFSFNKTTKSLYKDDKFIPLSKNEESFLLLLLKSDVVEDEVIKSTLWGDSVSDERLRTFVRRFRLKTSKDFIKNIKGFGYQIYKK